MDDFMQDHAATPATPESFGWSERTASNQDLDDFIFYGEEWIQSER